MFNTTRIPVEITLTFFVLLPSSVKSCKRTYFGKMGSNQGFFDQTNLVS